MNPTHVFWCEPSGKVQRSLRCFQHSDKHPCPKGGYCNVSRVLDVVPAEFETGESGVRYFKGYEVSNWPWDAFPTVCERCGQEIPDPQRQIALEEIFVARTGALAGQEFPRRDLPVGAMYDQSLYHEFPDWCGWDGLSIFVVTPDGEWGVDMRANNCTKPDDKRHRCWVRNGDPRTGYLHVDKDGTAEHPTCDAGAGSIWMNAPNGWHGFLYRGYLIDCDQKGVVDQIIEAQHPNPVPPAERSLKVHQFDRLVARPAPAAPVGRHLRSNRGFQVRRK